MNQEQIVNIIMQTINTIFESIFSSIDNTIYSNLDSLVFINSSIIDNSHLKKLLGYSGKSGLIYIADSLLLGICLFYIVKYYSFNILDSNIEKPSQFIFKLLISIVFCIS